MIFIIYLTQELLETKIQVKTQNGFIETHWCQIYILICQKFIDDFYYQ
jgi:hypothetical protein